jgi:hypothetical protein
MTGGFWTYFVVLLILLGLCLIIWGLDQINKRLKQITDQLSALINAFGNEKRPLG